MRLSIFALLSLSLGLVAAKKSPQEELTELAAAGNGVIKVTNERTFDLLTLPSRNWSAAIQFTALNPQRKCKPCSEFDPSFTAVAKAWTTVSEPERSDHFWATLDFDEAQQVFQKLSLASAPVVHFYMPLAGPRGRAKDTPLKYDFSHGFEAGPLAEQLSSHTPVPIPYKAPIDWASWAVYAAFGLFFLVTLPLVAPFLQNRWVWAAGSIVTSLIMTSGYMFTRIRGMPMTSGGQWIAAGYQSQYGQETQVVAAIYGLLGGSFLMLTMVTPTQTSPARQRTQVYVWTAIIFVVYSILIALFKMKNRGYPFSLLF
ncbi:oligosaccharyl transferase subunit OST3/OST6 family [Athelia psychrophila]|uniref:Oligosaccharyl transferase subunit OST3/OST6 family n=1 Tax=Athelia psychrophila TaxID=1759441 RepID=A0A166AU84_9AGAM|nr:oligosaccharyl transferase subunit OST3/OST6 family [Fibularhizoctonia sp. CBS 109695]